MSVPRSVGKAIKWASNGRVLVELTAVVSGRSAYKMKNTPKTYFNKFEDMRYEIKLPRADHKFFISSFE